MRAGTQVREITGNDLRDARGAGINRVYWDLRHQPLAPLAGQPAAVVAAVVAVAASAAAATTGRT